MGKIKCHSNNNLNYKAHRNGIKKQPRAIKRKHLETRTSMAKKAELRKRNRESCARNKETRLKLLLEWRNTLTKV